MCPCLRYGTAATVREQRTEKQTHHPQKNYIAGEHIIKGQDKRGTDIFSFALAQEQTVKALLQRASNMKGKSFVLTCFIFFQ